jgi:predicted RecA/RadA family phage recombinase
MAQNYVQRGHAIDIAASPVTAPGGSGIQYGADPLNGLFGVSVSDAVIGGPVTLCVTGVWTLPKVSTMAFNIGDALFWDNAAMLVTSDATGNSLIGIAVSVSANPSPDVNVRLNRG